MRVGFTLGVGLALVGALPPPIWSQEACGEEALAINLGGGSPGLEGQPILTYEGSPVVGQPFTLELENARADSVALFLVSQNQMPFELPELGATLFPAGPPSERLSSILPVDGAGVSTGVLDMKAVGSSLCGIDLYAQAIVVDANAQGGLAFSNGLHLRLGATVPGRTFQTLADELSFDPGEARVGDFDRDGRQDLLVARADPPSLELSFGDGTGAFLAPNQIPLPFQPVGMAVEDFDSDGHLDVVATTTQFPPQAVVLLGDGSGGFGTSQVSIGRAFEVVAADFNLDGVPDLATLEFLHSTPPAVRTWIGVGDGTFTQGETTILVSAANMLTRGLQVLESAGSDGPSLALWANQIPGSAGIVFILPGDGAGGFDDALLQPISCAVNGLALAEMTGDDTQDLVVLGGSPSILYVLEGAGHGAFDPAQRLPVGGAGLGLVVADFDGDATSDAAVPTLSGKLHTYFGTGTGLSLVPELGDMTGVLVPSSFLPVDLDGNGMLDLVAVRPDRVVLMNRTIGP